MDILEDTSPLGAYLNTEELERLATLCEIVNIRPGQELPESPFYCIYTGQVQVLEEGDQVLCTKYAGAFFTRRAGLIRSRKKSVRKSFKASSAGAEASVKAEPKQDAPGGRQRTSIVKDLEDGEELADELENPKTKIMCEKPGRVLFITADNLDKFLFVCKPESQEVVKQITRSNIGTQLANVPFIEQCQDLEPADLRALGEICSYKTYGENEAVFSQGDKAENFYIILKGSVRIEIDVAALRGSGEKVADVTRGVGDSFGVAALVYNAAERKYSAIAAERTLCLVITKENFGKFLSQKPSLEDTLMHGTKSFLLQRYRAMKLPIFGELDPALLVRAATLSKFKHFEEGDVVYRQGDSPSAFYVVLNGEVQMTSVAEEQMDEKSVAAASTSTPERNKDGSLVKETQNIGQALSGGESRTLTVGMHFGEVGVLLPSTKCIATCTCLKRVTLLTLESVAFLELFGADINLLAEMQLKLLRENATLRSALNHKRCRALFETHIKAEYSEENIKFFDAAAVALTTAAAPGAFDGDKKDAVAATAKELLKEYIEEGSDLQVNIPSNMRQQIEKAHKEGNMPEFYARLRDAQSEIYLLMARDNWSRFIKGEPFAQLLKDIGSYGEGVKGLVSENDLTMLVQDGEGGGDSSLMKERLQA